MNSLLTVFTVVIFAVALSQTQAKFYNNFVSVGGRVAGDQALISGKVTQNMDFYAKVTLNVDYPEDTKTTSNFILSNAYLGGRDDIGDIDIKFDKGGPSRDFTRLRVFIDSIKNGYYDFYLYGKKK